MTTKTAHGSHPVGTLTSSVKGSDSTALHRSLDALAAAETYATRLVAGLHEIAADLRRGDTLPALEALGGAVAGIRCLADILAAVHRATGVDTPPSADQELGRIALALRDLASAQATGDAAGLVAVIEQSLLPAVIRLSPNFLRIEARVAALA